MAAKSGAAPLEEESGYHCSPRPMNIKAWIDVKSPRFFYLCGYTRYWGYSNFCETCDFSNDHADISSENSCDSEK
jgi:hypothetical protein